MFFPTKSGFSSSHHQESLPPSSSQTVWDFFPPRRLFSTCFSFQPLSVCRCWLFGKYEDICNLCSLYSMPWCLEWIDYPSPLLLVFNYSGGFSFCLLCSIKSMLRFSMRRKACNDSDGRVLFCVLGLVPSVLLLLIGKYYCWAGMEQEQSNWKEK